MKLLYFSAPWCGPCRVFGPIMDKVAQSGVPVQKINVDDNSDLTMKYSIRNVPTVIKVDSKGNMISSFVGVKNQQQVIEFYNQ
jgi:thioredoxin 1